MLLDCRQVEGMGAVGGCDEEAVAEGCLGHGGWVPQEVKSPRHGWWEGFFGMGRLAVTYFHTWSMHYHRRAFVSRSCSGWEGVGPKGYGRQA